MYDALTDCLLPVVNANIILSISPFVGYIKQPELDDPETDEAFVPSMQTVPPVPRLEPLKSH